MTNRTKKEIKNSVLAAVCTLAAIFFVYQLQIPNPGMALVVLTIFFTATFGRLAGAVSSAILIVYTILYFSFLYQHFLDHAFDTSRACLVATASMVIIYLLVSKLRQSADDAYQQVEKLNHHLQKKNKDLEKISDYDTLTGIYNRHGGYKAIKHFLRKKDGDNTVIFAFLDVDNFKQFNDIYGHIVGDLVLQHLTSEMQKAFPGESAFIRFGGDEIMMLLKDSPQQDREDRLKQFASQKFQLSYQGATLSYDISCGYALYPAQGTTKEELFLKADTALYFVKMNGKHRAALYRASMDANL